MVIVIVIVTVTVTVTDSDGDGDGDGDGDDDDDDDDDDKQSRFKPLNCGVLILQVQDRVGDVRVIVVSSTQTEPEEDFPPPPPPDIASLRLGKLLLWISNVSYVNHKKTNAIMNLSRVDSHDLTHFLIG